MFVCLKSSLRFHLLPVLLPFLKPCLLLVFDASRTPFLFAPLYFLLFLLHVVCSAVSSFVLCSYALLNELALCYATLYHSTHKAFGDIEDF